jgi:hypothetical protein
MRYKMRNLLKCLLFLTVAVILLHTASAQSFPLAPPPGPQIYPHPLVESSEGFQPIFDGETLKGWEGDPKYWRVENHTLVGEITPETLLKQNSFIIWRGGAPADFELKAEYRITSQGNSGINYRSVEIPGTKYLLRGYQADIDGANKYTGQNYEERGRTFLAMRGQVTRLQTDKLPQIIGTLGGTNELESCIKSNDWNEYHLIASGNVLTHILNGHTMSVVIDEDAPNRTFSGMLGVQVHVGPPMKIEYRNFRLKALSKE